MRFEDEPAQQKLLLFLALGSDRNNAAKLSGYTKDYVDQLLAPGRQKAASSSAKETASGPIADDLYSNYPASEVLDRLSLLGLDRLAVTLGVSRKEVEKALETRSGEGMLLRFLLWTAERSRQRAATGLPGQSVLRYFSSGFNLDAQVLAGDGLLEFREAAHPGLVVHWDDQPWRPFGDEPQEDQDRLLGNAIMALGWGAFAESSLVAKRAVWNGQLVKLVGFSLQHVDDPDRAALFLELRRTDYVTHLATNYGHRRWRNLREEFSNDRRAEIAESLARLTRYELAKETPSNPNIPPSDLVCWLQSPEFSRPTKEGVDSLMRRLENERNDLRDVRDSLFANCLSVNIAYVTRDNYLIVQKRSKKRVGH